MFFHGRFTNRVLSLLVLSHCMLNFALSLGQESGDGADKPKAVFSGTITDSEGNPVTDAKVTLQGEGYYRSEVDEKGQFQFDDDIKPGEFRLGIQSSKWIGIKSYRDMPVIAIDPSDPSQRDFVLKRACQMAIKIVDETGGLSGVSVYYQPIGGEEHRNADSARTDANGIALIGGLEPGKYKIGINSKSHALAMTTVSVKSAEKVVEHEVALEVGEKFSGTILCSDDLPPAGWQIRGLPVWWKFGVYPRGVTVADDGAFELPNVVDEQYDVSVSIPLGNGMSTSRNALSNTSLLKLKQPAMLRLDYPSPKSLNYLTGTVRWIGKPLDKGLRISGYCADLKHHASFYLNKGETDFKIGPMPSGIYRIRVENSEVEIMNLRKIKGLDDLEHINVPNEKPLQLALRVVGKPVLRGHVVNENTGEPVDKFRYRITKLATLSGPNYVQEDVWKHAAGGNFESEVVGPGIYEVSVVAPGYAMSTSEHFNTDKQSEEVLDFRLGSGVAMQGVVRDSSGDPVVGAQVRALSLTAGAMPRVRNRFVTMEGVQVTDSEGRFRLPNLAEGTEAVRVDHPEFVFQEIRDVEISKNTEPLQVTLTQGASVYGTVYDANGKPLPDEVLFFRDSYAYGGGDRDAGTFARVVTDTNGEFEVQHLPSTTVFVNRSEEWSVLGVVRNALLATDGTRHRLDIGGTSQLSGRVLLNGEPMADTKLQIGGDDPVFGAMKMYGHTDKEGRFEFFGVPPGNWTLYRALGDRGSDWSQVRRLTIPAKANEPMELGQIDLPVGELNVVLRPQEGELPEGIRVQLRSRHPTAYFGRSVAKLKPRSSSEDPFEFYGLSPGDYELSSYLPTRQMVVQRMRVESEDLGKSIDFEIPLGDESLTLDIRKDDGSPSDSTPTLVSQDGRLIVRESPGKDPTSTKSLFTDLPAGRYAVKAGNMRTAPTIVEVDVKPGVKNQADVVLPSQVTNGICNLMIVDEQGIFLPCKVGIQSEKSITLSPGAFEFHLSGPAGEYPIKIAHPGYKPLEGTVQLRQVDPDLRSEDYQQTVILKKVES